MWAILRSFCGRPCNLYCIFLFLLALCACSKPSSQTIQGQATRKLSNLRLPDSELPAHWETVGLVSATASLVATPHIGGRVLSYSLNGYPNVLKVDNALLAQGLPEVMPNGENLGYLGHINWVGPQSQWWAQQSVNQQRLEQGAVWPPDPFTVLASASVEAVTPNEAQFLLPESPVTGLSITKTLSISPDGSVLLNAEAQNKRDTRVGWDLWFNTRLAPHSFVYVPVAEEHDVRLEAFDGTPFRRAVEIQGGILTLDMSYTRLKGKVFVQPSKGWMAAFTQGQLFVIEFEHLRREQIHPEQGQVELYLDYFADDENTGLLEMEVHSKYRHLEAQQSMHAFEKWRLYPYQGEDNTEKHIEELRRLGY